MGFFNDESSARERDRLAATQLVLRRGGFGERVENYGGYIVREKKLSRGGDKDWGDVGGSEVKASVAFV